MYLPNVVDSSLIVGAGALGSELLRHYAFMNLGCSNVGKTYLADFDIINRSNLHRQSLFR